MKLMPDKKNSMRSVIYSILLSFFFLQPLQGDIIAIIVCDTHAGNIENAVIMDLNNIRAEAQRIAEYTESDLKEMIFDGASLDPSDFLTTLKSLKFSANDSILFYFSGHGYRTYAKDDKIPWPNLFFSDSGKGIDYTQVLKILTAKNKRLLLAIADCCNNFMDDDIAPPVVKKDIKSKRDIERMKVNYKKLFLEKGNILVASSDISELSWCYNRGAVFTLALLEILQEEAQHKKSPTWKSILNKTSEKIKKHQTPVYLIY
jgi:hypothetical protein